MGGAAEGLISPLRVCEPGTPCRCYSAPAVCHAGTFCGHRCPCQAVPHTSPSRESPSEAESSMWSFVPKQAHALPASPGHMDFPISSCFVSSELRRRLLAGGHWAKEKRRHSFPACVSFIEGVATQHCFKHLVLLGHPSWAPWVYRGTSRDGASFARWT